MQRLLRICVFAFGTVFCSHAQLIPPTGKLIMNLDYSRFQYTDTSGYLEFYYSFYPRLVTYDRTSEGLKGGILLRTRIEDAVTGSTIRLMRSFVPFALNDTSAAQLGVSFATTASYEMKFGEFTISVSATDSLDQTRSDTMKLRVSVQPYSASTVLSDLQLCSSIKQSTLSTDPFFKNNLEVIPNPSLMFGSSSNPMLFYYLELYNVIPQKQYTVRSTILDNNQKPVKKVERTRSFSGANAVEVGNINVTALPSSRYRINVSLVDEAGTEVARTAKTLFVYNPHLQVASTTDLSAKESEFAGMNVEELGDEFNTAQYVATEQDIKTFGSVPSLSGRKTFLAKFWLEVEAGRLGKPAIARTEYLRRVSIANQRYRAIGKEGWRSDRGRIFILYGDPDEVERFPSSENKKPYEIWHYYQIENGVAFYFVDRSMFADYQLVNSTKRGELRDDSWERYLQ